MQNLIFLPIYDRIIVRPADTHGKTKGGLFIPEIAKANKLIGRGEVIAVGAGRITMEGRVAPLMVRVGDLAIYAKQQAQPIPWGPDDEECHVLREPDVLGVYRADESPEGDLATPFTAMPHGILTCWACGVRKVAEGCSACAECIDAGHAAEIVERRFADDERHPALPEEP